MSVSYRKPIGNSTPECIGALPDQSRQSEAAFLSLAMQNPYEAYRVAAEHDVSDADFAYIEHRQLFVACMVSAEVGIRRWSFDLFHAWNRDERFLFGDIVDEVGEFWLGPQDSGNVDDCAFRVKQLSDRRQAASDAARKLADVYGVEHAGEIVSRIINDVVRPHRVYQLQAQPARVTGRLKGRAVA